MKLRRVALENVRSFLDRAELVIDGDISIIIGPNGGGKTNLLDTTVFALRKFLLTSKFIRHSPQPNNPNFYQIQDNDVLNNVIIERHSSGNNRPQVIEIEVEVTGRDLENMKEMKNGASRLADMAEKKYQGFSIRTANSWELEKVTIGQRFTYRIVDGQLQQAAIDDAARLFLQYLQLFELDSRMRDEYGMAELSTPLIYLPVTRAANGFQSSVQLAGFNEFEHKKQVDATSSRSHSSIVALAVGRLAQKYIALLHKDNGTAEKDFYRDPNLAELTRILNELGYEWRLETRNMMTNEYDVRLKKQGTSFLVGAASSGERELLTYLFAIYALNVRDALIIIDEPELHLHPKWQKTLLQLFTRLAYSTGNQFLLATHSATFVSPESIQYVSRVYSREQKSHIVRLNSTSLPEARHLFNIVNSQNNERMFFADKVILVEGLSDRIFFEAVLNRLNRSATTTKTVEMISVGGKGLFESYKQILDACEVEYDLVADRDYIEQVGEPHIKTMFSLNTREIKRDVIDNVKSLDAEALIARIEEAMVTGSWEHARETWEYIKSRRRQLDPHLTPEQEASLKAFILKMRNQGVCILTKGALEAYLPPGYLSKDIDKLIRFTNDKTFWDQLSEDAKTELTEVAKRLISSARVRYVLLERDKESVTYKRNHN